MVRRRQLALPLGARPARKDGRRCAKRDWNRFEFATALARNGFTQLAGGYLFEDTTGLVAGSIEGVHRAAPLRLARRATLAKLLRLRATAHLESQKESQ